MPKILSDVTIQTSQLGVLVDPHELEMLDGVNAPIQEQLNDKIPTSSKGQPDGVAPLGTNSKVPLPNLPMYEQSVGFGGSTIITNIEGEGFQGLTLPLPITQGGTGTTTASQALGVLGAQPTNPILTGLTNIAGGTGIVAYSPLTNAFFSRTLQAAHPLYITNASGVNGNPTLTLEMGEGSGIDADLLDGFESSTFLRKDVSEIITNPLTISSTSLLLTHSNLNLTNSFITLNTSNSLGGISNTNLELASSHLITNNSFLIKAGQTIEVSPYSQGEALTLNINGNLTANAINGVNNIQPLNKTYGSIRITGATTSYAGIYFSSVDRTFMTSGSLSGMYQEGGGTTPWDYYLSAAANTLLVLGKAPATTSGFLSLNFTSTNRFQFRGDGNAWSAVHGWTPNWSDENLKRDITLLNSCLDIVNQLNPVSYRWNSTAIISEVIGAHADNSTHYGFIAQQINPLIKDIVKPGPEAVDGLDTYLTYEKTEIIPFLAGAIKELSVKLDNIEQRLINAGL